MILDSSEPIRISIYTCGLRLSHSSCFVNALSIFTNGQMDLPRHTWCWKTAHLLSWSPCHLLFLWLLSTFYLTECSFPEQIFSCRTVMQELMPENVSLCQVPVLRILASSYPVGVHRFSVGPSIATLSWLQIHVLTNCSIVPQMLETRCLL